MNARKDIAAKRQHIDTFENESVASFRRHVLQRDLLGEKSYEHKAMFQYSKVSSPTIPTTPLLIL